MMFNRQNMEMHVWVDLQGVKGGSEAHHALKNKNQTTCRHVLLPTTQLRGFRNTVRG